MREITLPSPPVVVWRPKCPSLPILDDYSSHPPPGYWDHWPRNTPKDMSNRSSWISHVELEALGRELDYPCPLNLSWAVTTLRDGADIGVEGSARLPYVGKTTLWPSRGEHCSVMHSVTGLIKNWYWVYMTRMSCHSPVPESTQCHWHLNQMVLDALWLIWVLPICQQIRSTYMDLLLSLWMQELTQNSSRLRVFPPYMFWSNFMHWGQIVSFLNKTSRTHISILWSEQMIWRSSVLDFWVKYSAKDLWHLEHQVGRSRTLKQLHRWCVWV